MKPDKRKRLGQPYISILAKMLAINYGISPEEWKRLTKEHKKRIRRGLKPPSTPERR